MYDLGNQFHFNLKEAISSLSAVVKGKNYRFTLLSDRLIRIEYSMTGVFIDSPSQLAICRNFPVPKFDVMQDDKYLEISTKYFKLSYTKNAQITSSSLRVSLLNTDVEWYYSHPEVKTCTSSILSFEGKEKYVKGIYSPDGFASIDDSSSLILDNFGNYTKRPVVATDIYLFMYNNDFSLALKDYMILTGKPQLLPRYAFGNWWSKNYAYKEDEIKNLFNVFEKEEIPISTLLLDKDWHITENKYVTGYSFNRALIPSPNLLIDELHKKGVRVSLSINPVEGIHPHEEMYQKVLEYIKSPNKSTIKFIPYDIRYIDIYLKILLHPLETLGTDFFFLDYPNTDKLGQFMLSHYMYLDSGRNESKRNMLISRNMSTALHRYGVVYSGKTKVSFDTLRKISNLNVESANIGASFISHDIGGFYGGIEDSELYIRYIQFGCFSPILRISVDKGRYYKREPWKWDKNTFSIVKEYMQLRHRLVPYIYSESYRYHNELLPLVTPLYHSKKELYYDSYYKTEYYFGSELLISPLTNKKDILMNRVIHKLYLPEGMWYDFKTGKKFPGGRTYVSFFKDEDYPVFAKSGAIIPLSVSVDNSVKVPEELEIHIFPGKNNTYKLYEDDGITNLYKNGYYLKTEIDYNYQANNYTVIIRSVEGKTGIIPPIRSYKIRFRNTRKTNEVIANFDGVNLETNCYEDYNDFIVEVKNVKTVGQLSINCKGKAIEIDAVRVINEDIDNIISDLEVETRLKDKIASILFSNLTIKKKRIQIRKLKKDKLDSKFIKMFLRLLEYVEQI